MSFQRDDRTLFAYSSLRSSWVTVPQELVDLILECLASTSESNNTTTLRNCALVSRAWTRSSQRVLFRRVRVSGYLDMSGLLACFTSSPQLAASTRNITIAARDSKYEEYPTDVYIICLNALIPLLTNVTWVQASFGPYLLDDDHEANQAFLASMYTFIHTSPVTELVLSGPCESASFATLCDLLRDSGITRLTLDEWDSLSSDDDTVTETLPFPCVEFLRFRAREESREEVLAWALCLPNLKHFELSVAQYTLIYGAVAWLGIFEEDYFPAVELESFTLEIVPDSDLRDRNNEWLSFPIDHINARHLFLTIRENKTVDPSKDPEEDAHVTPVSVRAILLWWLKNFKEAEEVCFDKLTLTVHFLDVAEVAEVWGLLDEVLSGDVYEEVDQIHFENWEGDTIDETSSEAANILSLLPKLARREVFDFVWPPESSGSDSESKSVVH